MFIALKRWQQAAKTVFIALSAILRYSHPDYPTPAEALKNNLIPLNLHAKPCTPGGGDLRCHGRGCESPGQGGASDHLRPLQGHGVPNLNLLSALNPVLNSLTLFSCCGTWLVGRWQMHHAEQRRLRREPEIARSRMGSLHWNRRS